MKKLFIIIVALIILVGLGLLGCFELIENIFNDGGDSTNASTNNASIVVNLPLPDAEISSPLEIAGQARGVWFFEATFPVTLVDWDGRIIADGHVNATADWMTENFVPFTASLQFEKPDTTVSDHGALILRKDNPSGLPQNDASIEIPIRFK